MSQSGTKRKRKRKEHKKDAEELALESFIFGGGLELELEQPAAAQPHEDATPTADPIPKGVLGMEDATIVTDDPEAVPTEDVTSPLESAAPAAAWHDDDDDQLQIDLTKVNRLRKLRQSKSETTISGSEYSRRLRAQFDKMAHESDWAQTASAKRVKGQHTSAVDSDDVDEVPEDEDLNRVLSSSASLVEHKGVLEPGELHIMRVNDANMQDVSQSVVHSIGFHHQGQVLFTAGLDKTLRLFQVDGVRNAKVQSVFFKDLPIRCAHFAADGRSIIVSGRRKFFYTYDLLSGVVQKVPSVRGCKERSLENFAVSADHLAFLGNDGNIMLLSAKTKQLVGKLKMNGTVESVAFDSTGDFIYSHGGDGQVYIWDVKMRRCISRVVDDGCIHGTAVAVSPNSKYWATGSDSGCVNIYDTSTVSAGVSGLGTPQPRKSLLNLTTSIDHLSFNHDSQLLAMSSWRKKDSLRVVHLPSCTVFHNWPTSKTPLHFVSQTAFSPNSGYLAVANDRGRVLLYRLSDYSKS